MDANQKVRDLMTLALDERTPKNEAEQAAMGALRIIKQYELLDKKKKVDVAASVLAKLMDPGFLEGVASHAEKAASVVDRILGSAAATAASFKKAVGEAPRGGGKRRKYGNR